MRRTLADMTAGKWAVKRYEDRLWRVWDGDGAYRGTYPTWEAATRDAYRVATILDRVRDALTEIDRLGNDAWAVWEHDAAMYDQGRSDAYDHAHTLITEALGDTP